MKTTFMLVFILTGLTLLRAADGDNQKPFNLTTLAGESYQNCRIVKSTPEGITILHDRGTTRIPFEKLNDDWKKRFDYNPEKAAAYQKAETTRRALAEERQHQLQVEREKNRNKQPVAASSTGNPRLDKLLEAIVRQHVETAVIATRSAISLPGLSIFPPGDPTPYFSTGVMTLKIPAPENTGATARSTTVDLVPPTTPISQIYTPGTTGSQHYYINQGSVFTPGDGSMYYSNPGYINPGFVTPVYTNPPIIIYQPTHVKPVCPPVPVPIIRKSSTTVKVGP